MHFNPRPSREGRPGNKLIAGAHRLISIHAPRGRGDQINPVRNDKRRVFQSTPLAGGATLSRSKKTGTVLFQSTPLAGGATMESGERCNVGRFQSTPLAGGATAAPRHKRSTARYFNPRPSREGRHIIDVQCVRVDGISIHAPRGRGDSIQIHLKGPRRRISIHAPRGRGDKQTSKNLKPFEYFNPRPSREGRLLKSLLDFAEMNFNPRPSREGRHL